MLALQGLTPDSLAERMAALTQAEARKIVAAIHRDEGIGVPIAGVRRAALEAVRLGCHVPVLAKVDERASAVDPFRKLMLAGADGRAFEAVRIPLEKAGRFSVCVSSQVGCALACAFCATGRLGLMRNLEVWEIVEQVRAVRRTLGPRQRISGVVFQGMGEPLANLDRVIAAIGVLTDPCAQPVDARAITVCTSGIPSGILRLARELPRVRLGVSIGSAIAGDRRSLMPIDGAHPLDEVLEATAVHTCASGYAPLWAVILLHERNDSPEHARAVAMRAKEFQRATGLRPRISIIPYNAIGPSDPFARSSDEREIAFRDALAAEGVFSHKRYSGGSDIAAACGQLVAKRTAEGGVDRPER